MEDKLQMKDQNRMTSTSQLIIGKERNQKLYHEVTQCFVCL